MEQNPLNFDKICRQVESFTRGQGVSQSQLLHLPQPLTGIFLKILRQGAITHQELVGELAITPDQSRHLTSLLIEKNCLYSAYNKATDTQIYRLRSARRPRSKSTILQNLDI
jgi:hypothetical protein